MGIATGQTTFAIANASCRALGAGWDLASIVDAPTRAAVAYGGGCFGTLPVTNDYWIGLYDVNNGATRANNVRNPAPLSFSKVGKVISI